MAASRAEYNAGFGAPCETVRESTQRSIGKNRKYARTKPVAVRTESSGPRPRHRRPALKTSTTTGMAVEKMSSLPVLITAKMPVETSRNSDTSKYRCTAGSGGALRRAVEAMDGSMIAAREVGRIARWISRCLSCHGVGLRWGDGAVLEDRVTTDFAAAAAILRVALEMGSLLRFFRARIFVRGSFGSSRTFARNGSSVMLR